MFYLVLRALDTVEDKLRAAGVDLDTAEARAALDEAMAEAQAALGSGAKLVGEALDAVNAIAESQNPVVAGIRLLLNKTLTKGARSGAIDKVRHVLFVRAGGR